MIMLNLLVILIGYLLGSIPWSFIVAKTVKNIDLRDEGDGRISTSAVFRRAGRVPGLTCGILDICMGALSVFIAGRMVDSITVIIITGLAAVIGHNWSVFLKFKGGMGATTIYGIISVLLIIPFVIGGIIALICYRVSHNSTFGTVIWMLSISLVLLLENILMRGGNPPLMVIYPMALLIPMFLKRGQVSRAFQNRSALSG